MRDDQSYDKSLSLGDGGFYGLTAPERQRLTQSFALRGETLYPRWRDVPAVEARWALRMSEAGRWLAGAYSVVDLGSHRQDLENHLVRGTRYLPMDCVGDTELSSTSALTREQRRRIFVVDFNRDSIPDVGIVDAAALGVLEYIYAPHQFMSQLRRLYVHVVLSYNIANNAKGAERRNGHAWVNHLSLDDCESLFAKAGFRTLRRLQLGTREFLWNLR